MTSDISRRGSYRDDARRRPPVPHDERRPDARQQIGALRRWLASQERQTMQSPGLGGYVGAAERHCDARAKRRADAHRIHSANEWVRRVMMG